MRRAVAPATLALLVAYEAGVGLWIYYGFREGHAGALGVALWATAELAGLVLGAYGGAWRFLLAPAFGAIASTACVRFLPRNP